MKTTTPRIKAPTAIAPRTAGEGAREGWLIERSARDSTPGRAWAEREARAAALYRVARSLEKGLRAASSAGHPAGSAAGIAGDAAAAVGGHAADGAPVERGVDEGDAAVLGLVVGRVVGRDGL